MATHNYSNGAWTMTIVVGKICPWMRLGPRRSGQKGLDHDRGIRKSDLAEPTERGLDRNGGSRRFGYECVKGDWTATVVVDMAIDAERRLDRDDSSVR